MIKENGGRGNVGYFQFRVIWKREICQSIERGDFFLFVSFLGWKVFEHIYRLNVGANYGGG